jgi:redox-sensitive bicupin YhaK (pirin superfamily)
MPKRSIRQVVTPAAPRATRDGMVNRILIQPGNWTEYDPFLVLVEDWMREPGGFPDHPHRGIETVTLVLDGELQHADNRGNSGVLRDDDVQWMTAGRGIIHAELPNADKTSHTLQLWLNLPAAAKMVDSAYQDLLADRALRVDEAGADIRLLSGTVEGIAAPAQTQTPVMYLDLRLNAGARIDLPVPASHNGFVLVLEGDPRVGDEGVLGRPGQVLWLDYPLGARGDTRVEALRLEADLPARVLVVSGEPIGERVVAAGPFVMNSEEEIRQAYLDFHSGVFGGPTPAATRNGAA